MIRLGCRRSALVPTAFLYAAAFLCEASGALGQTTGTLIGRVVDAQSGEALAGAEVRVAHPPLRTLTTDQGRFVLAAVPAGERTLHIERLGYRPVTLDAVQIRAGRPTELRIELQATALALDAVRVDVDRIRLIEPDIAVTHEVLLGRELRDLPVDRLTDAIELAPGVSDGHFRGGRVGQEVYVVDGIAVKNQLEASTQGAAIELSPTSIEEMDVITGGFGAEYGSALAGVVSFITRRGNPDHWERRAALLTDAFGSGLSRGFTGLSLSAGGPLGLLGNGTTVFVDLLAQGMLDAEPRARGLTCLQPGDVGPDLAPELRALAALSGPVRLHCPYISDMIPNQAGDKLIAFARLDRPLSNEASLTASVLRNRIQQQLYTPEFKYNPDHQLAQWTGGTMATLSLDWTRHREGRAYHVTARGAAMRLERQLGAIDVHAARDRSSLAGFSFSRIEFLGEDFVRRPIEEQIAAATGVPGYVRPGGSIGSPFGPAGEGIFFTEGTPALAAWTRSDFIGGDLIGELYLAQGSALRGGASLKLYRVESYERVLAYLPGSVPNYARFFPATVSAFAEARLAAADEVTIQLGARLESFRSGLRYLEDRANQFAPTIDAEWKHSIMPRIGVVGPVPGTNGATAFRFSFGLVAQPPDFRYFLDTAVGDSLRTDIRRQGNPNLAFERGTAYEVGLSHLLGDGFAVTVTGFRKELTNLVTGSLQFEQTEPGQFTTGDFGTVNGLEIAARARWPHLSARIAYALQKATGVVSSALSDTLQSVTDQGRVEFPLAFDRRHTADAALFAGRAAGYTDTKWSASLVASVRSGYPFPRPESDTIRLGSPFPENLPWTTRLDLRLSRELGALPGCGQCAWRIVADGRNVLGRANVLGLRRETGTVAPTFDQVRALAAYPGEYQPIPRESPRYSALIDLDDNGVISAEEFRVARYAAAIDRFDPTLFFAEPRMIRLGMEVSF